MTPEYGAASQLEKIDMLDFADVVAINKFERRGADDALREVRRQSAAIRGAPAVDPDELPSSAPSPRVQRRRRDRAVPRAAERLAAAGLHGRPTGVLGPGRRAGVDARRRPSSRPTATRYLAEIAETVRDYHRATAAPVGRRAAAGAAAVGRGDLAGLARTHGDARTLAGRGRIGRDGDGRDSAELEALPADRGDTDAGDEPRPTRPATAVDRSSADVAVGHRGAPRRRSRGSTDAASCVRWLREENLPGHFPFTAGVFPFKRDDEDPARMFAGRATPRAPTAASTSSPRASRPTRLSTAFDSVTLYGFDPDERPDIYGKVGNVGGVDRDARRHEAALRRASTSATRRPRCR